MFTGIIEALGEVIKIEEKNGNLDIFIKSSISNSLKIGQSIAHNGICLTVVTFSDSYHQVTAVEESLIKSTLNNLKVGDIINLERSLKFGDEIGGHVLSGHISCRAPSKIIRSDNEIEMIIKCPSDWINYIFHKGYVAINGASLTVAKKTEQSFSVYLIPETLSATNLSDINDGDLLNIEVDQTTYAAVKAAEARQEGS